MQSISVSSSQPLKYELYYKQFPVFHQKKNECDIPHKDDKQFGSHAQQGGQSSPTFCGVLL